MTSRHDTELIWQEEPGIYIGIGFVTFVNTTMYRGAVKVSWDCSVGELLEAFVVLSKMLKFPEFSECKCVKGAEILVGNEVTKDDYGNIFRAVKIAEEGK